MASVVDICNLAMSRLGDSANIASINPPEGSPQSDYCAQFWPIARDSALESHSWGFATKRSTLAEVTAETDAWVYAYAMPTSCLRVLTVYDSEATSDIGVDSSSPVPVPFAVEALASGSLAILTDQDQAAAKYIMRVTDSTKYSPLFLEYVSWLLASHVAGPLIKGDAGAKMAQFCMAAADSVLTKAKAADSSQRSVRPAHMPAHLAAR